MNTRTILISTSLLLSIVLSGCAGTVLRAVSESDRDTTGKYSGWWNAKSVETRSTQTFGTWRSNCSDPGLDFPFEVVDGELTLTANDVSRSAFVDKDGRFRITIPTGRETSAAVSSTRNLKSDTSLVLEGDLGDTPPVGRFTVVIVQLGDGCKSTVAFTKLPGRP